MQVVDKLDFSSWDVVAKDVAAELVSHAALGGAKLGPDGEGRRGRKKERKEESHG